MSLPLPFEFNPQLTSERLGVVAEWLLEELFATEDDLSRNSDDGYTRGCTTFGRQKNRIKREALSRKNPWLTLENAGNDLVFCIGGVPCRFSNDDPANPSKDAVLTANRHQASFLEFIEDGKPGRFCFIIDHGIHDLEDPKVEFLGFTSSGDLACRWVSDSVRPMRLVDALPVQGVDIEKPVITPKRRDSDASEAAE